MENSPFDKLDPEGSAELRKRKLEAEKEVDDAKKLKGQAEKEAKKAKKEAEKEADSTPKKGWLAEFFDKQKEKDEAKKAKEEAENEAEAVKESAEDVEESAEKTAESAEALEEVMGSGEEADLEQVHERTSEVIEQSEPPVEQDSDERLSVDPDAEVLIMAGDEAKDSEPEIINDLEEGAASERVGNSPLLEGIVFDRTNPEKTTDDQQDEEAGAQDNAEASPLNIVERSEANESARPSEEQQESIETTAEGSNDWGGYADSEPVLNGAAQAAQTERYEPSFNKPEKQTANKSEGVPAVGGFLVGLLLGRRRAMNKMKSELADLNKELVETNIELEQAQENIRSLQMKQAAAGNIRHVSTSSELSPDQQFASKTVGIAPVAAVALGAGQDGIVEAIKEENSHKAWAIDTLPTPMQANTKERKYDKVQNESPEKIIPIEKLPIEEQVKRFRVSDREYLPATSPDWLKKLHERVRECAPLPELSVWQMEYLKRKYPELNEAVERLQRQQRPFDSTKASLLGKRGIEAAQDETSAKNATLSQNSNNYTVSLPFREEIKKGSPVRTSVLATIVVIATAIATMYVLGLR